ncbi:MAG: hypothetical protein AAF869_06810 [Pseudomonadota bacterium]
MAEWTALFSHWETWAYAGLVGATLAGAVLSGRRPLSLGARYLALSWVASILIFGFGARGGTAALVHLPIDAVLAFLFYRLSRRYAWAGYVFIAQLSMAALHFQSFALPELSVAYAWALNAAFVIACGIVLTESAASLAQRRRILQRRVNRQQHAESAA